MIVYKDQNARVAMVAILHMFSLDSLLLTVQVHMYVHTYMRTYISMYVCMYVYTHVPTTWMYVAGASG